MAQAVQRLKIGESSPLLDTKYGYHILKLLERDSGGQKDLTSPQVMAQIRQVIFNRKEEMLRAAFSETARNKAQIDNYLASRLLESVGKANTAPASPSTNADTKKAAPKDEKKADEKGDAKK